MRGGRDVMVEPDFDPCMKAHHCVRERGHDGLCVEYTNVKPEGGQWAGHFYEVDEDGASLIIDLQLKGPLNIDEARGVYAYLELIRHRKCA